jgi:DNA repair protein RadD
MRALPSSARMIVGATPDKERHEILTDAREGRVDFLVSVNCLMVGVDVPRFDTIIWLRPTTSLVLYVQGIGRGLRLHPEKQKCLVLDFAGNLDRFGDFDDPLINEAIKPHPENAKDYVITCYTCNTLNTLHARRCIGMVGAQRCDHYFVWKDCHACGVQNDSVCRHCRECKVELIDPNAKLKRIDDSFEVGVISATYNIHGKSVFANYATHAGVYGESFSIASDKSRNIFYAKFVRLHIPKPSQYYMSLAYPNVIQKMLDSDDIKTPSSVIINAGGVKKKVFK